LLLKGETVSEVYGATTLPAIYVIGDDGKIVFHSNTGEALSTVIDKYLRERSG
jgi:hypothetical protein